MSIILTILKIIGISILVILGIVILLILLVLFMPLRYKAAGSYMQGRADLSGKISWLLGVISLKVWYQSGQPFHIKAKVLCITIFDNLKKDKKQKKERKRKRTSDEKPQLQAASSAGEEHIQEINTLKECSVEEFDTKTVNTEEDIENKSDEYAVPKSERNADEVEKDKAAGEKTKAKAFFAKLIEAVANIKFTFHKIYVIIVRIRDNIKYYWELLQQERTKQAFRLCTKQLSKIIKNISPRKYTVNLHLGFEDPAVMGNVLAVWGMLYPFHLGRVDIQPEFEQKVLEGSFRFRGRVSIYIFLWTIWLFVTDKNIRQLRKQLGI